MNKKEAFLDLIKEIMEKSPEFSKLDFDENFKRLYDKYRELFEKTETEYESADDKEAYVKEVAAYIPEYLETELLEPLPKKKREAKVLDLNMQLVTYLLPMMNYSRGEGGEKISEAFVKLWNEKTNSRIGNATYEGISAGFRKRLCYITTAVCEGLGKPDDCYELQLLRGYRDSYLLKSREGEAVVKEYYDVAPTIVKRMSRSRDAMKLYKELYEKYLTPCIALIEQEKFETCQEVYTDMVYALEQKYLYS